MMTNLHIVIITKFDVYSFIVRTRFKTGKIIARLFFYASIRKIRIKNLYPLYASFDLNEYLRKELLVEKGGVVQKLQQKHEQKENEKLFQQGVGLRGVFGCKNSIVVSELLLNDIALDMQDNTNLVKLKRNKKCP